ncbi:hypothetical protein A5819_003652 [Enterococcus sp. 7E2_DIV0204]|uniref:aldo/keto reductase n=1 Tax=unclassified Enterococcus TaxID=2608891 RepID=UPI000A334E16|nr:MULTISPECIES: aldo/keto reductase [unclassified Enterococcus]OTN83833.1 hypothetical protein A5819_003652 [Enterococcus sp. 7E2_DIV0204]OTP47525.1 hypothetical protein A5884_003496 [Enterococcus sp. 7D2_DIV0200]
MKKVRLNGRPVNPIGIGTWHMGDNKIIRNNEIDAIREGIRQGASVIDTAEMYGNGRSEKLVGEAISVLNRKSIFLISKFYPSNASEPSLSYSLDKSLERLETEYLDMYLLHWRGRIPLERTVYDLENLVVQGKIKSWGVSNFDSNDIKELFSIPDGENCKANEVLYNIASRGIEYDLLPLQKKEALPIIAYSPIDQGDTRGAGLAKNQILLEIAHTKKIDVFQLMLAWTIRNRETIAIPQTSNVRHMINNIAAARIELSERELRLIDSIVSPPKFKQPLDII